MRTETEDRDLGGIANLPATFTCFASCIVVFNVDTELKPRMYVVFFPYMRRQTHRRKSRLKYLILVLVPQYGYVSRDTHKSLWSPGSVNHVCEASLHCIRYRGKHEREEQGRHDGSLAHAAWTGLHAVLSWISL